MPILARVEGEGALEITISNNCIESLQLKIFEPPRLFEKLLEGRDYTEILDIVARICGICPVAYQMSATQAIENCFNVSQNEWISNMRRVFYCGEWIESHSLHIHFLAAPDFLGFKSAFDMANKYPDVLKRGLRLQAIGNALVRLLGGRSVHPVGACVGGFYKPPSLESVQTILKRLEESLMDAEELIKWVSSLPIEDNSHDFTSVSLFNPNEYPMNEGRIVSDKGLNIAISEFEKHFVEFQVPYSNALHALLNGQPYLVGPLARMNNNHQNLPTAIVKLLEQIGLPFPSNNMHHSMLARAVEIYLALIEAHRLLKNYLVPKSSFVEVKPASGKGFGCTEAPRGLLWHAFEFDEKGVVKSVRIVPPTSQNQARIEQDLRFSLVQFGLKKSDDLLRNYSEMIIRNYDPCISCSTHFLSLRVNRL